MLSSLQSQLLNLESAIAPSPLEPIEDVPSRSEVTSNKLKKNGRAGSSCLSATNRQTLRSRSFRVMRHLISVVDVSHLDQEDHTKSNLAKSRKQSAPKTVHGLKQPETEPKATGPSTSFQRPSRSQPVDSEEVAQGNVLHVAISHPPKSAGVQEPSKARAFRPDVPRVFHPKRPRKELETSGPPKSVQKSNRSQPVDGKEVAKACSPDLVTSGPPTLEDAETLSQPKLSASQAKVSRKDVTTSHKPTGDETTSADANQKTQEMAPSLARYLNHRNIEDEDKAITNLFECDLLAKYSNRFALLKHHPSASDLPIPGKEHRFIITPTQVEIRDLNWASASLIQKRTLGVWEWKENTSMVRFYECKIPTSQETISKRRFKYVGWAWKGKLDQQPPKIQDLPDDIYQGCDTLRWYRFKDLWLLFLF